MVLLSAIMEGSAMRWRAVQRQLLPVLCFASAVMQAGCSELDSGAMKTGQLRGVSSTGAELNHRELLNADNTIGHRRLASTTFGTFGEEHRVDEDGAGVIIQNDIPLTEGSIAVPPPWDSALCLRHWGRPELQQEADPNGYIIFVNGMEQLGGNRYLVSDGLFIAKALDRTLVEYPVKDSRISDAEAQLGLGTYWDLSEMCMYHRILDLQSFRAMVADGRIPADDFVTMNNDQKHEHLTGRFHEEQDVRDWYKSYKNTGVIVLEHTWKSSLERESSFYMRPNPFYVGFVRMLLETQKDWMDGNFIAVQWRTETSTGDLTECYEEVKALIEEQRKALGLESHQVFFNTDLLGNTSGTYRTNESARKILSLIREDYPKALDNQLLAVAEKIEDSGVKAFVSGLTVASARVMIASSLNDPSAKDIPEAGVCQKPYSGYIKLITDWRQDLLNKDSSTVIPLFPSEV